MSLSACPEATSLKTSVSRGVKRTDCMSTLGGPYSSKSQQVYSQPHAENHRYLNYVVADNTLIYRLSRYLTCQYGQ